MKAMEYASGVVEVIVKRTAGKFWYGGNAEDYCSGDSARSFGMFRPRVFR